MTRQERLSRIEIAVSCRWVCVVYVVELAREQVFFDVHSAMVHSVTENDKKCIGNMGWKEECKNSKPISLGPLPAKKSNRETLAQSLLVALGKAPNSFEEYTNPIRTSRRNLFRCSFNILKKYTKRYGSIRLQMHIQCIYMYVLAFRCLQWSLSDRSLSLWKNHTTESLYTSLQSSK